MLARHRIIQRILKLQLSFSESGGITGSTMRETSAGLNEDTAGLFAARPFSPLPHSSV